MIDLYTGTPGSGKSLHIMKEIRKWIKADKPVIGNFAIKASSIKTKKWGGYLEISPDQVKPESLEKFSDFYRDKRKWERIGEEQILLVIDECQLYFNSREWQKPDRRGWISFFTQHRKLGYRVILCCQYNQMIDKQVRSIIEYEYIHRKVKNIGMGGRLLNGVALGGLHVCVKVYVPLNEKVGSEFFKADPALYHLYDTYQRY